MWKFLFEDCPFIINELCHFKMLEYINENFLFKLVQQWRLTAKLKSSILISMENVKIHELESCESEPEPFNYLSWIKFIKPPFLSPILRLQIQLAISFVS